MKKILLISIFFLTIIIIHLSLDIKNEEMSYSQIAMTSELNFQRISSPPLQEESSTSSFNIGLQSGGYVTAVGGTTETKRIDGTWYKIHTFTGNGTLEVSSSGNVDYLVVAGGGGGGGADDYQGGGGGGGGGGVLSGNTSISTGNFSITVGSGGTGTDLAGPGRAYNGEDSIFHTFTAVGGGRGGGRDAFTTAGAPGGSGGGAHRNESGGAATSGQGNDGGNGGGWADGGGGGGGGAGSAGQVGEFGLTNANGGDGGNGTLSSITGTPTYYGGGGGGGASDRNNGDGTTESIGGLGGGGNGASDQTTDGSPGTANTGGGGGGGAAGNNSANTHAGGQGGNGAAGGSGIVIIRYEIEPPETMINVQHGETVFTTGDGTQKDVTIDPVDLDHTFILMSVRGEGTINSQAFDQIYSTAELVDETTIRFNRYNSSGEAVIAWQVIEANNQTLTPAFSVQTGELSFSSSDLTLSESISPITSENAIVVVNSRYNYSAINERNNVLIRGEVNNNQVTLTRAANNGAVVARYYVVEFADTIGVQKGTVTQIGTAVETINITAVNLDRSLLFFTYDSTDDGLAQTSVEGWMNTTSQIAFERETSTGNNTIEYAVLTFPYGVTTQQTNNVAMDTAAYSLDQTLSPTVYKENSFSFHSNKITGTGTAYPRTPLTSYLVNDTTLRLQRSYDGQNPTISWQVVNTGNWLVPGNANATFVSPTPENATRLDNNYALINASIETEQLHTLTYNWDATNYTIYDSSLVLMMNFDNVSALAESSSSAHDASIYGNHGTISGASWTSGKYGKALEFDGVNDYVTLGDKFEDLHSGSIAFWINPAQTISTGWSGDQRPLGKDGNYEARWNTADGVLEIDFGTAATLQSTTTTWQAGTWYHVAVIWNSNKQELFVNGMLEDSTTQGFSPTNTTDEFYIGRSAAMGGTFNGTIDEFRIWERTLEQEEIYQYYISNLKKIDSSQWHFESEQIEVQPKTQTYQVYANNNFTEQRTLTALFPQPYFVITANSSLITNNNSNLYYDLSLAPQEFWDTMGAVVGNGTYATGGDVSYYNDSGTLYRIHTFETDGTLEVINNGTMEYLIVAGGGGGGVGDDSEGGGAGGGAGGLLNGTTTANTGSLSVTVGRGGSGGTCDPTCGDAGQGGDGQNSSFNSLEARGGGGGGGLDGATQTGRDGGSGGGATRTSTPGSGTSGQGNDGGNGADGGIDYYGGGGGGAISDGGLADNGMSGGNGLSNSINGTSVTYATGGKGGEYDPATTQNGTDGTNGEGDGGGGGDGSGGAGTGRGLGGRGGDGIVIVRYEVDSIAELSDGGNIRVYTKQGEQLAREVVGFNPSTQTGSLFFNSKNLSTSTDTQYIIHYGDTNKTEPGPDSEYGKHNVWDGEYKGIWHLEEDGSSEGQQIEKSTRYGTNGEVINATYVSTTNGQLSKAISFLDDGVGDWGFIDTPSSDFDLDAGESFSIQGWFRAKDYDNTHQIIWGGRNQSTYAKLYKVELFNGNISFELDPVGNGSQLYGNSINNDTWYSFATQYNGTHMQIYMDGSLVASQSLSTYNDMDLKSYAIGANAWTNTAEHFNGDIDEIRFSKTAWTSEWIQTEFNNQNNNTAFWSTSEVYEGKTRVGGPTNWIWDYVQPNSIIPIGGPTNWSWQESTVQGSWIRGNQTNWTWT